MLAVQIIDDPREVMGESQIDGALEKVEKVASL